jgi:isocitrate dehydrogenase
MVIFRENTEDIYAGIEMAAGTPEPRRSSTSSPRSSPRTSSQDPLRHQGRPRVRRSSSMGGADKRDTPVMVGIGIKPVSKYLGTERLVHSAIEYALKEKRKSRHDRPQGQHHEVHRGRLQGLGLQGRHQFFRDQVVTERESWILGNKEANPTSPPRPTPR